MNKNIELKDEIFQFPLRQKPCFEVFYKLNILLHQDQNSIEKFAVCKIMV